MAVRFLCRIGIHYWKYRPTRSMLYEERVCKHCSRPESTDDLGIKPYVYDKEILYIDVIVLLKKLGVDKHEDRGIL